MPGPDDATWKCGGVKAYEASVDQVDRRPGDDGFLGTQEGRCNYSIPSLCRHPARPSNQLHLSPAVVSFLTHFLIYSPLSALSPSSSQDLTPPLHPSKACEGVASGTVIKSGSTKGQCLVCKVIPMFYSLPSLLQPTTLFSSSISTNPF